MDLAEASVDVAETQDLRVKSELNETGIEECGPLAN